MDNKDKKPDYEIDDIFNEVLEDESWEPDKAKREAAINGLRMTVNMT